MVPLTTVEDREMKQTLFVSFSGGRTSAYMCWWLLNNKADEYDFIFVFANTGQEHEETLIFVDRCDKAFGLNLVWVEAVVHHDDRKSCTHKIVNFNTADREGVVFEEVIKKYGIPNMDFLHCTRELKLNPMRSYKQSIGFGRLHRMAIGIRVDEIDRMSPRADIDGLVYPLIKANKTKPEIIHWWKEQDLNLNISEEYGNCVTCWKKSNRKLYTIAKNNPKSFSWNQTMEEKYCDNGAGDGNRRFFRGYTSASDIIATSKIPFNEFKEYHPELQLQLEIDPLDLEMDCGAGCEI